MSSCCHLRDRGNTPHTGLPNLLFAKLPTCVRPFVVFGVVTLIHDMLPSRLWWFVTSKSALRCCVFGLCRALPGPAQGSLAQEAKQGPEWDAPAGAWPMPRAMAYCCRHARKPKSIETATDQHTLPGGAATTANKSLAACCTATKPLQHSQSCQQVVAAHVACQGIPASVCLSDTRIHHDINCPQARASGGELAGPWMIEVAGLYISGLLESPVPALQFEAANGLLRLSSLAKAVARSGASLERSTHAGSSVC